jgi:glutamyl-tRNA synthetase
MPPLLRFAPSPTGRLHLGNARTALVNWLYARHHGGRLILRLDDTDRERSTEAFAAGIEDDLRWLGLDWDGRYRQSERGAVYAAAFARLEARGAVYPAYETAEELQAKRDAQRSRGLPPVYDRAALDLGAADRRALEAAGRRPHWRFRLAAAPVAWRDLVQGEISIPGGALSDPVLRKADGGWTYTLASVADDIDLAASHIIRGDDHRTNTAVQIELFMALGAEPPAFAHLPLLTGPGGTPLSKRSGDWSVADYRDQGIEPHAIRLVLAAIGTDRQATPETSLDDLVASFDLARFGRSSAVLDPDQLARTSAAVFQSLPLDDVHQRPGLANLEAAEWQVLGQNARNPTELLAWLSIVRQPLVPLIENAALLETAADLLPDPLPDAASAARWLDAVKKVSGTKGRALMHPLRLALTAREDGPKLADLLPLFGRERVLRRLRGQTA